MIHFHHAHLFASNLDASIRWYINALGAEVCFDGDFGGARNVFMRIGQGRLHLYSQPPRQTSTSAVHHLGIRTSDLAGLHGRLVAMGIPFRSEIHEYGNWRYIMCPAPDSVLLELFEIDTQDMPPALANYFGDASAN